MRHILPNVLNSAIVLGTLMLGVVIITEAALTFLGVGVPPPKPAWGLMLADGKKGMMVGYWWLTVLPGVCIMLMVLAANLSAIGCASDSIPSCVSSEPMHRHESTPSAARARQPLHPLRLGAGTPGRARGRRGLASHRRRARRWASSASPVRGKTTLALTILRLLPPAARIVSGAMLFDGEDLLKKSDAEMRRMRGKRIAMILQDPDGLAEPAVHHRRPGGRADPGARGHPRRATAWSRARELLKAVRIPSPQTRLLQHPHQMSGGMRQRIVGAIGISCGPRLLIADEPTTNLDLTIQAQYLNLLRELQRAHGLALIFITHNLGIVAKMCDQLAVMYAGRVVESGPVRQIFNAPAHPYTKALLNSIPRMSDNRQRLTAIDGQPPDLVALPPGCAFAPRCPSAFDAAARRRRRSSRSATSGRCAAGSRAPR